MEIETYVQPLINVVEINNGLKGERGTSLQNATVREDGHLILEFDNGATKDAGVTALIDAATYRDEANKSAAEAKISEEESAKSETNAAKSAEDAMESEKNASDSEQNAGKSEENAQKWAESMESPDGKDDTDSSTGKTQSSRAWALYSKDRAKASEDSASRALSSEIHAGNSADSANTSAMAAASSEQNAKQSENIATEQAQSATNSADNANVSEINAKASETAAKTSETNSKQSELNAASSEVNALQYKNDAQTSKDSAATSASNASKSEINAKASANSASSSASSAIQSASNASASETHAATSETNAQIALTEVQKIQSELEGELSKIAGAIKYCGTVDNYANLPTNNNEIGDMWNVRNADTEHEIKAGDNVVWDGEKWDNQSGYVDLSDYPTKSDVAKAVMSVTYQDDTITFIHKDSSSSTATVNNVAHAVSTDKDGSGNNIENTYYKKKDAQTVHASFQTSLNYLSNNKQDKLTFDNTPISGSSNPVTSGGIKTVIDDITTGETIVGKAKDSLSCEWSNVKNKPSFSSVATSGSYNDLLDTPTPINTSDFARLNLLNTFKGINNFTNDIRLGYDSASLQSLLAINKSTNNIVAGNGVNINLINTGSVIVPTPLGDNHAATKYYVDQAEQDINNTINDIIDGNTTVGKAYQDHIGNNIEQTYLKKYNAQSTYETISQANKLVKTVTENEGKVTVTTQGGSQNSFYTGLNLLQRNKSYAVGDIAYSPNLPSWAYLECIEAGTTGASEPDLQSSGGGGTNV